MKKIEIVDYQPRWADEFSAIQLVLQQVLNGLVVSIDHIGSTAVPDLVAKDVIDIQVSVKDLDNPCLIQVLSEAGYVFRPDITHDNLTGYNDGDACLKKLYFREPKGQRPIHIHIREIGRVNQVYALKFRDFLRDNKPIAQAYGKIKSTLARRFPNDETAYYELKDPYMDSIFYAASLLESKDRTQ
ncbi:GrpB family protein [Pseudoalteromonas luteoviolacea]|uniref:Dephospho-CoA kinase n=1 Tax=Pseudoalteromonas luteoviolacea S4054 TaxID=1129367 RepID=A0A0F6A9N7_9GAMM|nr:GrpB family protein [Pseudoalteromonas luteoviolacea]AOT10840.1 hypothetical protein S4054249_23630 [Pseudoalteromonas luteoviolacea]AOT15998.1 hypothetical protein S40542_24880 [Pseudoalteromonas luteoviolacea]AOT20661.1 hypothetical protein S4054_23550 [Pseudoalteromonas luteoviolacea]KKE82890.1 hypothetical protein N479_16590 [Pseudoalteromonas luteoviolacea S4054]KZN75229.1 hypothetical protein N481_07895 [Pseudoalteromonas luteoviolacea S4047-1]